MTKEEIIVTMIGAVLSSGLINALLSHIMYNNKLKKELKFKGNDMIARDIGESLQFIRNTVLKLSTQEIYNVEEELEQKGSQLNMFDGECIYPAIFNDWDSFNEFHELIQECRSQYEKHVSCKIALNIVFIDRYLFQARLFINENGGERKLPFWGTLLIADIQKWQTKMDKMLVKEINKYSYKLESHETWKWKFLRKRELINQWEKTILYYLITGKHRKRDKKKMQMLDRVLEIAQSGN